MSDLTEMESEMDRRAFAWEFEQERISYMADEMADMGSILAIEDWVNNWIPDDAGSDLAMIIAMSNSYRDDDCELGNHVRNYVRGLFELVARNRVEREL